MRIYMNSKYFLLMILTICKAENHSRFKEVIRTFGIGLMHLHTAPRAQLRISQNALHPVEYQKQVTEVIEQSSCVESNIITQPSLSQETIIEEIIHGLPKSDYDYLHSCHPKFLATVVKIKEWSPSAVDWLAWTNKKLVKNWITQLDEQQAILFCQIKNSADETFEEFLQKTSTLKALFIEAREEFQKRAQLAQSVCAS